MPRPEPDFEKGSAQLGKLYGDLCGAAGVVVGQLNVGFQAVAAGQLYDLSQQERRGGLALDTGFLGIGKASSMILLI